MDNRQVPEESPGRTTILLKSCTEISDGGAASKAATRCLDGQGSTAPRRAAAPALG
ncbi:hypothetical protein [Glutamicibacter mysorens]|uniref:hypothetical protein n=1 Tax=Glutamicibacter mysorens TaxID=257984 RepID=UPI0012ED22E0|nr:hypothetical protein [Glutamicibacter mysorens]